jgi:hypothetical protein
MSAFICQSSVSQSTRSLATRILVAKVRLLRSQLQARPGMTCAVRCVLRTQADELNRCRQNTPTSGQERDAYE